jgi:hypothetical protein
MSQGWIKLHRCIQDGPRWEAEPFTRSQAWIDMLLNTSHKPHTVWIRGIKIELERGQLALSQVTYAKRWKWSRTKVNNFLKELSSKNAKNEQQIKQQKTNVTTLVTIINWDKYQSERAADKAAEEQQKSSRKAAEKHIQEWREGKNVNNVKNTPQTPEGAGEASDGSPRKRKRASKDATAGDLKKLRVKANTKAMKYIGALFGRGENTLWNQYEAKALEDIGELVLDEVNLIGRYYRAEMEHGDDIRRRSVETLLNNWMGELDRAALWERNPKPKSSTDQNGSDKYRNVNPPVEVGQ